MSPRVLLFLLAFAGAVQAGEPITPPGLPALPKPVLPPATEFRTYGNGIPLVEFLRISLGEMAHRSYVLAPDVSNSQATIAHDLAGFKSKDVLPIVREVLRGLGFQLRDVQGVLFVDKLAEQDKPKPPQDVFVYKPVHRTIGSLSSYFSVFPDLTFSYSAGISLAGRATPATLSGPASAGASPLGGMQGGIQGASVPTGAVTFSQQDKDPSLLVVKGSASTLAEFKAFLPHVDIPIPEVLLHTYVYEVRDTDSKDSAVQLVADLLDGKAGITLGGGSVPEGGAALRIKVSNMTLALGTLSGDSRVRLVSSTRLRAKDGSTADATVGTDTPTLGAIVTSNGTTQQSVQYQSAGVLLSVSPRILEDSIHLTISQELSSFVKTDTGLTATPTKLRRAFHSDAVANDGEVLLLGGLSEVQEAGAKQEAFGFFGSRTRTASNSQLVVMIKVERL